MPKIILHVDMDAFFVACEEKRNPKLKGKPVVVGSDPKGGKARGVVSTSNYSARKYGVFSATPISKAYRLCPHAVFLPIDFKYYGEVSKRIMEILNSYTKNFQQVGVDEAYLDVSGEVSSYDQAKELALKIKDEIYKKENLTCSIGVGVNKLIAKIGSDHNKPNGLTVVQNKQKFLHPLPIRKLYGIGPKTEKKLKHLGIRTIKDLALFNKEMLLSKFGVYGSYLHLASRGVGNDIVKELDGRSSISKERTFVEDVKDFTKIYQVIEHISTQIEDKLKREYYSFRTISIKIRLSDFKTFTRSTSVKCFVLDKEIIIKNAIRLCEEFKGQKIRLIGVRLSNLSQNNGQKSLKEYIAPKDKSPESQILALNETFSKAII